MKLFSIDALVRVCGETNLISEETYAHGEGGLIGQEVFVVSLDHLDVLKEHLVPPGVLLLLILTICRARIQSELG